MLHGKYNTVLFLLNISQTMLLVLKYFLCWQDKPHSPRGQSENKSDQMSIPSVKIAKGKAAERRGFLVPSLDILPAYWDQ